MTMTIGKEAREKLRHDLAMLDESECTVADYVFSALEVLDRCTDAPATTCPHIVTSDEGTSYCGLAESGAGAGEVTGDTSDGYHTFNELYAFRLGYNAVLFNEWARLGKYNVHKSWRHHEGEECFGGGYFIVVAMLPGGQISNHYKAKYWEAFHVPEHEKALFPYDGHTGADVLARLGELVDGVEGADADEPAQEAHPPTALPHGWVAVPVEPAQEAHPPTALPHGWVAVPVEPTQEMVSAAFAPKGLTADGYPNGHLLSDKLRAAITAAPPHPGLVRLPEGWPWTDRVRRHVKALLLWEKEESDRMKDDEVSIPLANLARWIEHAGAADGEEGGGNE